MTLISKPRPTKVLAWLKIPYPSQKNLRIHPIRVETVNPEDIDIGRPESLLLGKLSLPHREISTQMGGTQCPYGSSLNALDGQRDFKSVDTTYA